MRQAYARLEALLLQHFASPAATASAVTNARSSSCLSASLDGSAGEASDAGPSRSVSSSGSWAEAQALVQQQLTAPTAAGCLQQAEDLWPQWAAACCRLQRGAAAGAQPSAVEAAAVLQHVAQRSMALPPRERQQELAKSRQVRGLIEALRLPAGTASLSTGSAASEPGAVAAALWALAVLGGSVFWEAEADALCGLLPACGALSLRQVRRLGPLKQCGLWLLLVLCNSPAAVPTPAACPYPPAGL